MKAFHLFGVVTLLAASTTAYSQALAPGSDVPGIPGGPLTIVADENGFSTAGVDLSTLTVNGLPAVVAVAVGPDGVPTYSTGGIFVAAGDIQYTNVTGVEPPVSDLIRIYSSQGVAGDTFSVFSYTPLEMINGTFIEPVKDSRFDVTKLPAPNLLPTGGPLPIVSLPEFPVTPYIAPAANSYTFISDNGSEKSPEPATLGILFLGAPLMLRRARRQ